jgi:hypothetical protein
MRGPDITDAEVDDEIVALNIDRGTCYGLNSVGSQIWRLVVGPIGVDDICASLLKRYRVDPNRCEQEVLELLNELESEGLIVVCESK